MAHLTVVLQADQPEVGRVAQIPDWPLHVTLLQAFRVEASADEVVRSVAENLRQVESLKVMGAAVEYFGPSADIEVTVVEASVRLIDMHLQLLTRLSTLRGFEPDTPAYSGDGYRPHVTACSSGSLSVGASMRVSWAAVIDMDGGPVVLTAVSLKTPR
jgi:2'-5' RNA ligase